MTIALAIKVNDGLVLTADSATTLSFKVEGQDMLHTTNVFNNGEKITNLHHSLPIGIMTWGLAFIKGHSINWHAKELRLRFEGKNSSFIGWQLDKSTYQMSDVANRVHEYFASILPTPIPEEPLIFGLLVGGYSSDAGEPEVLTLQCISSVLSQPVLSIGKAQSGSIWFGQPEALTRLVRGVSMNMPVALANLGVDASLIPRYLDEIMAQTNTPVIWDDMPIQDVIDLAHFLVDTTIKYTRFIPGPNTVGGPIDVAAITKHEGFKWVERKHFYPIELNPEGAHSNER